MSSNIRSRRIRRDMATYTGPYAPAVDPSIQPDDSLAKAVDISRNDPDHHYIVADGIAWASSSNVDDFVFCSRCDDDHPMKTVDKYYWHIIDNFAIIPSRFALYYLSGGVCVRMYTFRECTKLWGV